MQREITTANRRPRNARSSKNRRLRKSPSSFRVKEKQLELSLIKSYPSQVVWETWLPCTPLKRTTTVTTGLIATGLSISSAAIASFATRFGSTFVEYRIIRAKFLIRLFSSTAPGVLQYWIDEKSTSTPTLAEAQERAVISISASATDTMSELDWTCADPVDLAYLAISTVTNVATLKEYTNNANFGSSTVATDYYEVIPKFQVQFRGLQGV